MTEGLASIAFVKPLGWWSCCMCGFGGQNVHTGAFKLTAPNGVERFACPPCARSLRDFLFLYNGVLDPSLLPPIPGLET